MYVSPSLPTLPGEQHFNLRNGNLVLRFTNYFLIQDGWLTGSNTIREFAKRTFNQISFWRLIAHFVFPRSNRKYFVTQGEDNFFARQ